jgi:hypothetical protein
MTKENGQPQCKTCKNPDCPIFTDAKERELIQEKNWCEPRLREIYAAIKLVGCASHSTTRPVEQALVPGQYQCSFCKRNKYNGDSSCPLDLSKTHGNSDIFDGINRVINSCGCGKFVDTRSRPVQQPAPEDVLDEFAEWVDKLVSDGWIIKKLVENFKVEQKKKSKQLRRQSGGKQEGKGREK